MDAPREHSPVTVDCASRGFRDPRSKRVTQAVAGLTLEVPAGQWVCILGPNGSGKTTLFRMIAGLDAPDEGSVKVFGHAPLGRMMRRMGVVFHRPALDPLLSVRENLWVQGALHGIPSRRRASAVTWAAEVAGIVERLDSRAGALSSGLLRRADLARAMLSEPDLLLLDEPTVGLDHAARMALMDALRSLRDAAARTVVMSTHLMDEAARADRVIMLDAGRIVADGSPDDLRAALGGVVVKASSAQPESVEAILTEAGLACERHGRIVTGRAPVFEQHRVDLAISRLLQRGAGVSIGPPTLADAYLAKTGKTLEPDDPRTIVETRPWSTGQATN